jgi:arylsulfatase A-like enzyme
VRHLVQRREFLKSAVAGGVATRFAGAAATRPNVLFMIADDLYFRGINAMGNPEVHTPNLDRLMKQGVSFTHCFHQGSWQPAVCVASRSMLNSGLTCFHAEKQIEHAPLWGETFGGAGYDTCIVGKWHLSNANLARSFKTHGKVSGGMFESGPEAYNRPAPGNTWTPWDTSLKGQWLHTREWQSAARSAENTSTDSIKHSAQIWAENAADHLREQAGKDAPFFLYVGFNSPHDPRQAPREFVNRYPAQRIEVPPNYLPEHPFDQGDHKVRDELLAPFPRTREAVQVHRSEYYAHITYMDEQVGRIVDALAATGKAANTYIVFTADHGLAVGQHGLMGKQNLYDHSVRVPLIVNGPGIPTGKRIDEMVYQHSVFATTCELAGVPAPKSVEFPSLVDLLHGKQVSKHEAMFCFYRDFQRSIRTEQHKLIVYPQAGKTQLFDIQKDPWETNDLSADPKNSVLKNELSTRLTRMRKDLDDALVA